MRARVAMVGWQSLSDVPDRILGPVEPLTTRRTHRARSVDQGGSVTLSNRQISESELFRRFRNVIGYG